ncbi:MAG: RidA family protein [Acidimicrobiales bacterium]
MSVQRQAGPAGATYSSATTSSGSGRWIHVSGQLPVDGDGQPVDGSLAAQTGACFDRIAGILAREGATLNDVVRIAAYLTNLDDYAAYSRARGERFDGALPASTAVGVASLLGGAMVEIDAVAFVAAD